MEQSHRWLTQLASASCTRTEDERALPPSDHIHPTPTHPGQRDCTFPEPAASLDHGAALPAFALTRKNKKKKKTKRSEVSGIRDLFYKSIMCLKISGRRLRSGRSRLVWSDFHRCNIFAPFVPFFFGSCFHNKFSSAHSSRFISRLPFALLLFPDLDSLLHLQCRLSANLSQVQRPRDDSLFPNKAVKRSNFNICWSLFGGQTEVVLRAG